ncbi:MAG: dihydroneopterin aldolase [Bacteroidetes Order II. Incertae sedis bacterium]|nr:dihydroneopterin aldolase [Bacteroidetes Order II. bacterium]
MTCKGMVRLMNAVFYAHHGVMQEEHRIGGRYEVDVIMRLDFQKAAETDELDATVDYGAVYEVIRELVTTNKFYLIERLAFLIGEAIMYKFSIVEAAEVTVRKVNPPVGGTCDKAEAVFEIIR